MSRRVAAGKRGSAPGDEPASTQSTSYGLKLNLPPITSIHHAFKDLLSKRRSEIIAVADNGGFELRVGTICSGTEAPIFALKLIKEISQLVSNGQRFIEFNHLFSVENEPFKQAYISRNAPGSIIFRDVVDFADRNATTAPTILGIHREIPGNLDLLIAGTSCVDFSSLNNQKRIHVTLTQRGAALAEEWKNSDQSGEKKKSKLPLRKDFFDDFRKWLNDITPAQIQSTGEWIGESSITFLSTVCYINNHRPKMVILENVYNAPWDSMCGLFLHGVGYAATHVSMDTKEYYIPQTRNRGYVVAVDRQVFGDAAEQVINEWKTQVSSLKRGASTPVQHWLLSSNDPLAMRARQDESEKTIANSLKSNKDSQWVRSKSRHARVRRQYKLGKDRPLTAWGRGGIEKPYDRMDRLFLRGQNDRAQDCVDIYYLRCLHAGSQAVANHSNGSSKDLTKAQSGPMQYDIKFKSQIFDLSQNVDRGQINRNFGITGCLTPRGMNLITDQGRLVSGFEALNLQGLPLRDLDLTRESQDELRDLAGNAMSTTVVGAALFSLLIAVHRHRKDIKPPPLKNITSIDLTVVPYQPLYQPLSMEPNQSWSTVLGPFCNVKKAIDLLKRCRRYCYCNGGAKYSTQELVLCQVCGIYRCKSCEGNPEHKFDDPPQPIQDTIMNDMVPQVIMELFPTALTNIITNRIGQIPFSAEFQDPELQSQLLSSLRTVVFYYTQVLISETVTVCYSAKDDKCSFNLQAVISDTAVTWYLFLDPWSRCGQQLSKRLGIPPAQLFRPFGRVRILPSADKLIPEQSAWEFWVFTEVFLDICVEAFPFTLPSGSIEIKSGSYAHLPDSVRDDIKSISGIYKHHPKCDAAEDSLHVKSQNFKRYLFKDPTRLGPTQEDCYIISDDCRLLEKHEFRDFCLRFPPNWTPKGTGPRVRLLIKGYWKGPEIAPSPNLLVHHMRQSGSRHVPANSEVRLNKEKHQVQTLACVGIDSNTLDETYMTLSKYERVSSNSWAIVLRSDYSALFDLLAPVNINLDGIESTLHQTTTKRCGQCTIDLPDVHWMEKALDKTKKGDRNVLEPYRLSGEMCAYEEQLRKAGEVLTVAIKIKDNKTREGWKEVRANYELNIDLLRHRAANYLPQVNSCSDEEFVLRTTVDTKKESLYISNLRFESFKNSLRRLKIGNTVEPSKVFINGHVLSEKQEISLDWMLNKEREPLPFTEREIEECWFNPLNLRVLGVAERNIVRPGGILADDVGYGKTIISLALMQAQQASDRTKCHGENEKRDPKKPDTLALAASLVLVPKHLVDQWREEAIKFLGWKTPDVLVIKSSRDLKGPLNAADSCSTVPPSCPKKPRTTKVTTTLLDEFKAAKLVIVSIAVFDDDYYTWLGKYAGSLAQPRTIPKAKDTTTNLNVLGAFQDWYEDATAYARKHLWGYCPAKFNPNRLETIERHHKSLQDAWKKAVSDYYDTTTRLGCETTRGDKTGRIIKGKEDNTTVSKQHDDIPRANLLTKEDFATNEFLYVLEAFSYSRVIYDEFSYDNFCVAQFVRNAKAHAKWVLSATPPTSNIKAVCDIGQLLGIHVARPVKLRPGLPLITEGPAILRQDNTEKQLSYGKLYTDKSVCERVEQAHRFLQHFASANPFDEEGLGKIKVNENVMLSHMNRFELASYLDMQRDLRNCDLDISNLLIRRQLDSDAIKELPAEGGLRAGLALAYIASVDCTNDDDGDAEKLLKSRRRDLKEAQERLQYITNVATWLILRRFDEKGGKKNESATSYIEDFAWHIEAILEGHAEVFGSAEGCEAVSCSIDEERAEECSKWLRKNKLDRTSEAFCKELVTLLSKQMTEGVWATYFQLPPNRIVTLDDSEVYALIRNLDKQDLSQTTPEDARQLLENLINKKRGSVDSQAQQAESIHNKALEADDGDKNPKYPRFRARKKTRGGDYTETESEITDIMIKLDEAKEEVIAEAKRFKTAENLFCPDDQRKCVCGQASSDLRFLPDCGHFICSKHQNVRFCGQIESEKYRDGSGCSALAHERSIPVQQIDFCRLHLTPSPAEGVRGKEPPKVSPKSQKIVNTIAEILPQGDDKILVFYQFSKQKQEIRDLLEYYGILFHDFAEQGATISRARQDRDKDRVRIMKLNSEEAAGSNYQDANHVIFTSTPVFGKQEDFEKYVKQAKGRVIRHGQRKQVDIYYFATANTFEVDLLQLRKRAVLKLKPGKNDVAELVDKQQYLTDSKENAAKDREPDTGC
ncbi:hypothetical protein F5Y03DRAFT_396031 [Xylaria venustula]|nr:hypothetical protein F5Y03DRAFT_396031 [Xylaria venustula]